MNIIIISDSTDVHCGDGLLILGRLCPVRGGGRWKQVPLNKVDHDDADDDNDENDDEDDDDNDDDDDDDNDVKSQGALSKAPTLPSRVASSKICFVFVIFCLCLFLSLC